MKAPVDLLTEYVSHASVSTDSSYAEGMAGARDFAASFLRDEVGCRVDIIETPKHPIILGRRTGDPAWPHVIIYGHYDVQPADPLNKWTSPPFKASIRDGRIYGRGTADNKGPQLVHLIAAANCLRNHPDLPLRMTFLIEGEEEIGSPSFTQFLEAYGDSLRGDLVLLSDTLSPSTEQIAITTGLRGIVCLEATLHGPASDLHSGIHGGAAPNPIRALAKMLAYLHDESGAVTIDGFYDDVHPAQQWEKEEVARLGLSEAQYIESIGAKGYETAFGLTPFEATRFLPTLEFNGIYGGYTGEGTKTIVPSSASVKISCRLVPEMDPQAVQQQVIDALVAKCASCYTLTIKRDHSGHPYGVVPPDRPNTPPGQSPIVARAFRSASAAIGEVFGVPPLFLREGGSVPIIADLKTRVGLDSLMIGMFTPKDNLHAPNESMDLRMFEKGIAVSEKILAGIAADKG